MEAGRTGQGGIELSLIGDKSLNDLGALSFAQRLRLQDVFESLNPIGAREINLNFSASPIGSVKAFENVVKRNGA
jgi:hypothetical protein